MALIRVDADQCKKDGICIETCPLAILEFKTKDALPTMIRGGEILCIHCGHCVAVCPHHAMNHAAMQSGDCPPIRKELSISSEQAEQFLRSRRSIRVYKKTTVDRNLLTRLIHTARHAPSGHNTQPVEWIVIYDRDQVRDLIKLVIDWMRQMVKENSPMAQMFHMARLIQSYEAGSDRIFRGAPHLIIAHCPQALRTSQSSTILALSYLELMAPALGLGTCWAGYFMAASNLYPPLIHALKLPQGHAVFGAMMVGYPKYRYHRLHLRKQPAIEWRTGRT